MTFSPDQAVVVLGTSRSQGNTRKVVDAVLSGRGVEVVDLSKLRLSAYDYGHGNKQDDFLPLLDKLATRQLWIFATPVYWYAMSSQLKTFMDRLTDIYFVRQDLIAKIAGRSMALLASGSGPEFPDGFESPFKLTCDYLGMRYAGSFYWRFERDDTVYPGLPEEGRRAGPRWLA